MFWKTNPFIIGYYFFYNNGDSHAQSLFIKISELMDIAKIPINEKNNFISFPDFLHENSYYFIQVNNLVNHLKTNIFSEVEERKFIIGFGINQMLFSFSSFDYYRSILNSCNKNIKFIHFFEFINFMILFILKKFQQMHLNNFKNKYILIKIVFSLYNIYFY